MRAREHREPDEIDVLVARGRGDLRRREPDALVDDLHPRVARRHRDLFGAVRVAVEPGLADQDADGMTDLRRVIACTCSRTSCIPAADRRACTPPTPVGARYSPNTSRSAPAHSPTVPPARASAIVAGTRFSDVSAVARSVVERAPRPHRRRARRATGRDARAVPARPARRRRGCATLRRAPVTSGESAVSVKRFTPITGISPDSIRRTRSAWLCTSRCFIASIMAKAPAALEHPGELGLGGLGQLRRLLLHHV